MNMDSGFKGNVFHYVWQEKMGGVLRAKIKLRL